MYRMLVLVLTSFCVMYSNSGPYISPFWTVSKSARIRKESEFHPRNSEISAGAIVVLVAMIHSTIVQALGLHVPLNCCLSTW
jgi:hypothetical protein